MTSSRRDFLLFSTAAAVAAFEVQLPPLLQADTIEPRRSDTDEEFIRLHSNENAYGPSPKVAEAINLACSRANRYPRLRYGALTEQLASMHHVSADQVLLGCGSTEILRVACLAVFGKGGRLVQASPTFEAVGRYAVTTGAEIISVPLTPSFAHDLDAMLERVGDSDALVYLCNPNNPTASLTPRKDIETFVSRLPAKAVVLIDEAYHHFAGASGMYKSFIDYPVDDKRVIVTRTFSKAYGLAGLRLGYAVAPPNLIQQMRRFLSEDNINVIVTHAAAAALADTDGLNRSIDRVLNDRQEFFNQAMARALKPIDSHTNFVMMNTFQPAEELIEQFRNNNILIGRRFPSMDTYIRVSLGKPEEMQAFWKAWDTLPHPRKGMAH